MTAALEGGEWSAAGPGRTLPRERSGTHCTGGWVSSRVGLDETGKLGTAKSEFHTSLAGLKASNLPTGETSQKTTILKVGIHIFST